MAGPSMTRREALVSAAGVAVALSGCSASRPPPMSFDRAASGVNAITVPTPAAQPKASLESVAPLIGGPSRQAAQRDELDAILREHGFRAREELSDLVLRELGQIGFRTMAVKIDRPAAASLPDPVALAGPDSDATLDLVLSMCGYGTWRGSDPWKPLVGLSFRLVRRLDRKVVMQGGFSHSIMPRDSQPSPIYDFDGFRDIVRDPDRAVAGIREGLRLAALHVATTLR